MQAEIPGLCEHIADIDEEREAAGAAFGGGILTCARQYQLVLCVEQGPAADGQAAGGVQGAQGRGGKAAHRVGAARKEVLEGRIWRGLAVGGAVSRLAVQGIDETSPQ